MALYFFKTYAAALSINEELLVGRFVGADMVEAISRAQDIRTRLPRHS
jgi:hypothetical protein